MNIAIGTSWKFQVNIDDSLFFTKKNYLIYL